METITGKKRNKKLTDYLTVTYTTSIPRLKAYIFFEKSN
jgi:hypothetical protein